MSPISQSTHVCVCMCTWSMHMCVCVSTVCGIACGCVMPTFEWWCLTQKRLARGLWGGRRGQTDVHGCTHSVVLTRTALSARGNRYCAHVMGLYLFTRDANVKQMITCVPWCVSWTQRLLRDVQMCLETSFEHNTSLCSSFTVLTLLLVHCFILIYVQHFVSPVVVFKALYRKSWWRWWWWQSCHVSTVNTKVESAKISCWHQTMMTSKCKNTNVKCAEFACLANHFTSCCGFLSNLLSFHF